VKIAPAAGVSEKTAELPASASLPRRGVIEIELDSEPPRRLDRHCNRSQKMTSKAPVASPAQ
jgi:hypothetical protein